MIHPQSIVHALVGFNDGALMAHIGPTDMRHAIGFALNFPNRLFLPIERLDLSRIGHLDFKTPDLEKYPALRLAFQVLDIGGLSGALFNAAKEVALDAFIARKIGFLDMAGIVESVLNRNFSGSSIRVDEFNLENILLMDQMGRDQANEEILKFSR